MTAILNKLENNRLDIEPYYALANDNRLHAFVLLSRKQESFRPEDYTIIDTSFTPAQYLYKEDFRKIDGGLCLDGGTDLAISEKEVKGIIKHFDSALKLN